MKALVYQGPGRRGCDTVPDPVHGHSATSHLEKLWARGVTSMLAYDTFADAANTNALKVVLEGMETSPHADHAAVGTGA